MVTLELVLETKEGPYPMYLHLQTEPLRIRLEGTCPWIVNPYGRWEEVKTLEVSETARVSEWRKALEKLARL
jgi:hypothetical protein